jgi:hypothetical protein
MAQSTDNQDSMAQNAGQALCCSTQQLGDDVKADEQVATTQGLEVLADGGLAMLKERQRKDAEEVAAGLRDPRSLWVVQKGDLKGFTFAENPKSKYAIPGVGW